MDISLSRSLLGSCLTINVSLGGEKAMLLFCSCLLSKYTKMTSSLAMKVSEKPCYCWCPVPSSLSTLVFWYLKSCWNLNLSFEYSLVYRVTTLVVFHWTQNNEYLIYLTKKEELLESFRFINPMWTLQHLTLFTFSLKTGQAL